MRGCLFIFIARSPSRIRSSRVVGYSRRHYVGRTISTTTSYRTPAAAAIWSMLWPAVKSRRVSCCHSRSARVRRWLILRSASNSSAMPHEGW